MAAGTGCQSDDDGAMIRAGVILPHGLEGGDPVKRLQRVQPVWKGVDLVE